MPRAKMSIVGGKKKNLTTKQEELSSYENRLSRDQYTTLRSLIDDGGKALGNYRAGTIGSLIKRGFAVDTVDNEGDLAPAPTTLGLKAMENYSDGPAAFRKEFGPITAYVMRLLSTQKRKRHAKAS